ncbi:tRNA (guanosine(18)-2'-O)-methyltransferase [mine drainage metagenome]|uniref:tRNA (Guanosine(18)-2'-O)-methyltransferase n=1 Tax=mine drainage metagenome TaxID=410659 RepID=A0A1J5TQU9_9ZZZZ
MVNEKSNLRKRADEIKNGRCRNLIAVLEEPSDPMNIGTVIRNINALGVDKLYIVDSRNLVPDDWQSMKEKKTILKSSVSAIKWSFVKKFKSTEECLQHLEKNKFISIVTSPHVKGKTNVILHKGDYTQKRLAVWFGKESIGISDLAVERSMACINIEMFGIIESLNLATSTGIVLYEITKQRREFQNSKSKKSKGNKF